MGRADALTGHLPSLWRPGVDTDGPVRPFGPSDVLSVVPMPGRPGAPRPVAELVARGPGVLVSFDRPGWPRRIRLRPGLAPGLAFVLEVRRFVGDRPETMATATVAVRNGVVDLPSAPAVDRLTLVVRQRHLLDRWLRGLGAALDGVSDRAVEVMQAHWVATSDSGLHSPWLLRRRQVAGQPPLDPTEPDDQQVIAAHPHVRDLARLGALVPVAPWREPPHLRDLVEGYRERLHRTVALYRHGLSTVAAIRRSVETRLPIDPTVAVTERDPAFTVEEFSPSVAGDTNAVAADGPPTDLVGPLMRWPVVADGLAGAAPTVHIEGQDADPDVVAATDRPVIELLEADGSRRRVGIGYRQTVPADTTLQLAPTTSTWLIGTDGLRVSTVPAGPEAGVVGPWAAADGAPADVVALAHTFDHALWAATTTGGSSSLWRHDGSTWTETLVDVPPVACLAASADDLVVGTAAGQVRLDLHPTDRTGPAPDRDLATMADPAVHALSVDPDGSVLVGGAAGLERLHHDGTVEPLGPGGDPGVLGVVRVITTDRHGSVHVGGDTGLFVHQPTLDHWYAFAGEGVSETVDDWHRLDPATEPPEPGLPSVRSILRGRGEALWLGTAAGLARYRAVPARAGTVTFATRLEAFPDLGTGPVQDLVVDARGVLWAATDRGLVRHDGRDLEQVRADGSIVRLGRADTTYPADAAPADRGMWRFDRAGSTWQEWDGSRFTTTTLPVRTDPEPAVRAVLVTDGVQADLLQGWDATTGEATATTPVDPADLVVRVKPDDDTRVVDGGIPALPRVPPGPSTWRYLALEPPDPPEPTGRPAWTVEGRLLPPPAEQDPAGEGRFDAKEVDPERTFDGAVFAFLPAARVWMTWRPRRRLTTLVRLRSEDPIDPAVLDRVWDGIELARPAGVRVALAVEDDIVRGDV